MSRFTAHVLRGLRGEAGVPGADVITLSDLYRYVHRRMTEDGKVIPQRRFDGDGEIQIARAVAAAAPPVPSGLVVSPTRLTVTEVEPGQRPPTEYVAVRSAAGGAARFEVDTSADWLVLRPREGHFAVDFQPVGTSRRANIAVRDPVSGDIEIVRVSVEVKPAAEPAEPTGAEPAAAEPTAPTEAIPSGFETALLAELQRVGQAWLKRTLVDSPLHVHPDIPKIKATAARAAMRIPSTARLLALCDGSVTRTATVGWAVSSIGFHVRETGGEPRTMRHGEFAGQTITVAPSALLRLHAIQFEDGPPLFSEFGRNAYLLAELLTWVTEHVQG
jgi:hypothetical protein